MAGAGTRILTEAPVWETVQTASEPLAAIIERNLQFLASGAAEYLDTHSSVLLLFGMIACLLFVLALQLRRMARATVEAHGAPGITLRHPFLVLAMLWLLFGPELLLPTLDTGLEALRVGLVMGMLVLLLPEFVAASTALPLRGLLVVTFLVMTERALLGDPLYGRIVSMVLAVLGIGLFRRLQTVLFKESVRSAAARASGGVSKFLQAISLGLARYAPPLLLIGLLAEAIGAEIFGNELTSGVLYLATVLVAYIAADMLVEDAVVHIVQGPAANWLRSVRNYPDLVIHNSLLVFRVLLVVGFLALLPAMLPLLQPVWSAVGRALATPLALGSIGLSFSDVIAFGVSVLLAIYAARLVRFLLQEDVVSRLPLSVATSSAVTRLVYYGVMIAGVFFAFAAAGLELSQLTMVVSALSVGIGFGLQDVVKNFVSGLVIAFEHPFREGDVIASGQTTGRVQEIGLRASRIRTFEGAEVMVPNANLIAADVTNWTLSDRTRRIEIMVGVDYGSDPRQVLEVLRQALVGQPGLAADPEPLVLFKDFGASSLDFSVLVWTPDVDERLKVESEARLRIFAALAEAGIGIPFPQLDLHVRDVSPELRASSHSS
jgi:small-conductance mechanosensitive channel